MVNHINSYVKPQFDNEKVYQLIEETVDKIFLPTIPEVEEGQEPADPLPYVSPWSNTSIKLVTTFDDYFRSTIQMTTLIFAKDFQKKSENPWRLGGRFSGKSERKSSFYLFIIKLWHPSRHRIIVQVSVVEKNHQGIHVKMKFLVDAEKDNYVKYYLDNPNFFIIVNVVMIYKD